MTERAYAILGVDPTASDEQVRTAYRRLAQIYHPDRFVSARQDIREEAERRMMDLNSAFAEISRTREIRDEPPVELPSWWRPAWDKVLQQEDQWLDELKKRRQETHDREVVHRRWEQIERIARDRTRPWAAHDGSGRSEPRSTTQPSELPAQGATTSDRIARLRQTVDAERARQARAAADGLRRTIDLDAPQKRHTKAGRRSKD